MSLVKDILTLIALGFIYSCYAIFAGMVIALVMLAIFSPILLITWLILRSIV